MNKRYYHVELKIKVLAEGPRDAIEIAVGEGSANPSDGHYIVREAFSKNAKKFAVNCETGTLFLYNYSTKTWDAQKD